MGVRARSRDCSQPGLRSHRPQWDVGTGSICCSGRPDPGAAGSCRAANLPGRGRRCRRMSHPGWAPTASIPLCEPSRTGTASLLHPSPRNVSVTGGLSNPAAAGGRGRGSFPPLSRLHPPLAHGGRVALIPPSSGGCREHPGGRWPIHVRRWRRGLASRQSRQAEQAGAGRPPLPSCFALPQRPRKEVVAFLGEEKGSRAASAGRPAAPAARSGLPFVSTAQSP